MAQQMNNQNNNKDIKIDKNKLRNLKTRDRLKEKLRKRKEQQEKNIYNNSEN